MNVEGPKFKLQWFREGEAIPHGSKFIKSGQRKVGTEEVEIEDWPPYGGSTTFSKVQHDVTEEQYLYEVPDL